MKNVKHENFDLSVQSISNFFIKEVDEDLPLIGYHKLALLKKNSEDEVYKFLLQQGESSNDMLNRVKGDYIGAEILRIIYSEKDPLSLILKVHLLIENFINEIISKYRLREKRLSFKQKLDLLVSKKLISDYLSSDVSTLNRLRNHYAHDYYYDIGDFLITKFNYAKNFYDGIKCRRKITRALLNLKTLQFLIFPVLIESFLQEYPFLIKKKMKKRLSLNFYDEGMGDKLGKLINQIDRETRNTNFGWGINLRIFDKSKKKGSKVASR